MTFPASRFVLIGSVILGSLACGPAEECPDSYGACLDYVDTLNAEYEACDNETRVDPDEACDEEALNPHPDVCVDCVEFYECFSERVRCVDGQLETEEVDCPACGDD